MRHIQVMDEDCGKVTKGLLITSADWQRLYDKAHASENRVIQAAKRIQKMKELKEKSQAIISEWDDNIVNSIKRRERMRREQLERIDEDECELVVKMQVEENQRNKEIRTRAIHQRAEDKESSRDIASSLTLAEVLRVRAAQVEFNKKLKAEEDGRARKIEQAILDDQAKFLEEQREKKQIQSQLKMKMSKEARQMVFEAEQRRLNEAKQTLEEGSRELLRSTEHIKVIKEAEEEEKNRRRQSVWDDIHENRKVLEEKKRLENEENDDENTAIHLTTEGKRRLAMLRKQKELEMQANLVKRRNLNNEKLLQSLAANNKTQGEAILLAAQAAEMEQRTKEKEKREWEQLQKIKRERHEDHAAFQREKNLKILKEKQLTAWELLNKFKTDEVDIEFDKMMQRKKLENQKMLRESWKEQLNEKRVLEEKKREDEKERERKKFEQYEIEDTYFFNSIDKIKEESKKNDRPMYPINKCLEGYKRKHHLAPVKEIHPIFKSKVPVAHPEEEKKSLVAVAASATKVPTNEKKMDNATKTQTETTKANGLQ